MKLVCETKQYGDRIIIQPEFCGEMFFFTGDEPEPKQLILIELPSLPSFPEGESVGEVIKEWLNRHHHDKKEKITPEMQRQAGTRRRLNELPEEAWRGATLHDLLEAQNYRRASWGLDRFFTLQQFSAFANRWLPEAQQKMHNALSISSENERLLALKQMHPFFKRLFHILEKLPNHILEEHRKLICQLEETQVVALRGETSLLQKAKRPSNIDSDKWLALASTLQTEKLIQLLLMDVAHNLAKPDVEQAEIKRVLKVIDTNSKLKEHITCHAHFWKPLHHCLRLDSTVQGEIIDISDAQEVKVKLDWLVYEARRIGRIVPKRRALLLIDKEGQLTYIAAQRQLKFQILRAGGRLEKFGNTLIMSQDDSNQLNQALLNVEMLDTLANVAPEEAITHIKHLNLPSHHPIFQTARAAKEDPKQSRILADLLIELVVGIDADVARRLVRTQGESNRLKLKRMQMFRTQKLRRQRRLE